MNSLLILISLVLTACASHPEAIPSLPESTLPALKIESLKPQTIAIAVKNSRAVNLKFNNSNQIEAVVQQALIQAAARGGLTIDAKSSNKLSVEIKDCENIDPNLECVSSAFSLKTKHYEVEVETQMQNGMVNRATGETLQGRGDLSQAYQQALSACLTGLPKQVTKFNEKYRH
jgi:uncharacterized protein YcfL